MNWLRNVWYQAGWSSDVTTDAPLARTILDTPLLFFRGTDGSVAALLDRCPHRFAPLSAGRVDGGVATCGYHGLGFGADGACVANPHGPITSRMRARAFPVAERHSAIWIWLGESARADADLIPDLSFIDDTPPAARIRFSMPTAANYQLLVDNLFDLSHVEFIHPFLANKGWIERARHTVEQHGDTVTYRSVSQDDEVPAMALQLNPKMQPTGTSTFEERWDPPSVMRLNIEYHTETASWIVPSGHFLTPETPTSTHYFLRGGQTVDPTNVELTAGMRDGTLHLFQTEDVAMIEAQQRNLGSADLMEMQPAILRHDAGAIRARRVLARRIREEAAQADTVAAGAGAGAGAAASAGAKKVFAVAPATAEAVGQAT